MPYKIILALSLFLIASGVAEAQLSRQFFIDYDTANFENMKLAPNNPDSAFIDADEGFYHDTVSIEVNGRTYSRILTTDPVLGLAGGFIIPKAGNGKTILTIKNTGERFDINLDKRFPFIHLSLLANKVIWSYTNKIYTSMNKPGLREF